MRRLPPSRRAFPATLPTLSLLLVLSAFPVRAQTPPDSGHLQRQSEQGLSGPRPAQPPAAAAPAAPVDRSGPQMTIQRFAIEGASLIPEQELLRRLDSYLNRPLSLGELQAAAQQLVGVYRECGWFARVQLPPQDASTGTLRIRVIEGRFGRVIPPAEAERRSNTAAVERLVGRRLQAGQPYSQDDLERGLLLANDLPGIRADGVLQAGEQIGSSDLALRIQDGPLFSGQVSANNAGSRFTGRAQAATQLALNSPSGYGDQLGLSALVASRLRYVAVGYSLPLGSDGLRANLSATQLRYKLGEDFTALDANGTARTTSAGLAYPVRRSTALSLWLGLDATQGRYKDNSLGAPLRDRQVDSVALSLYGNSHNAWGGGGASDWRLALSQSRVALGLAADQAQDALGPQSAGQASRLQLELRREQRLGGPLAAFYLRARLTGQQASRNLDSSQKFGLGGPYGVRGFPGDDGYGDSGMLLQLELHRPLSVAGLSGFAFLDSGRIRQHQQPWAGWDTRGSGNNSYNLSATGLGLSWTTTSGLNLQAVLARPLGGNPGSGVSGKNQDGSTVATRFWLTLSQRF